MLTPPARKVNNNDLRLRQTPFHAPFWTSKPYIASRLLEPKCWMFAQCDFPICHAHQAE